MYRLINRFRAAAIQIRRRRSTSLALLLTAGLSTGALVAIVAKSEHRQLSTLTELSSPATRSIIVRSVAGSETEPIPASIVDAIVSLPAVTQPMALSAPETSTNAVYPNSGAAVGRLSVIQSIGESPLTLRVGRQPEAGESIISRSAAETLGFLPGHPGRVTGSASDSAVVGIYESDDSSSAIGQVTNTAILTSQPDASAELIALVVDSPADLDPVSSAILQLFTPFPPNSFSVEFDQSATTTIGTIARRGGEDTTALSRWMVGIAAILVGLISLFTTAIRRRDIARQRALGRTRADLAWTLIIQITVLMATGSALGAVGVDLVLGATGVETPIVRSVAAIGLSAATGAVAALPAVVLASLTDPAKSLRVA